MKKVAVAVLMAVGWTIPAVAGEWMDRMDVGADFRFRYEMIDQEGKQDPRERARLRLRLQSAMQVNDHMRVVAKIASGGSEAVSTNQTLGSYAAPKAIALDRAYLEYHRSEGILPSNLKAGKIGVPFHRPGGTELLWDGDLSLEGAALSVERGVVSGVSLNLTGAYLWLDEIKPPSAGIGPIVYDSQNVIMSGGQAYFGQEVSGWNWKAGGGYYHYGNIWAKDPSNGSATGFGNTVAGGGLAFRYDLIEAFAELGAPVGAVRGQLFASYSRNAAVDRNDAGKAGAPVGNLQDLDEAWILGLGLKSGKLFGVKDLIKVKVEYREVESDSVFAAFSDSDFGGGGTAGGKDKVIGTKASLGLKVMPGVSLNATQFINQTPGKYNRTQLDMVVKFP